MRSKSLIALLAIAVLASVVLVVPAASGAPNDATKTYIVQMQQSPVVAYTGGVGECTVYYDNIVVTPLDVSARKQ